MSTPASTIYLVCGACAVDDIIIAGFDTYEEAKAFAQTTTPEDVCRIADEIYGRDTSIVFGLQIIKIEGGRVVETTSYVKDFEGAGPSDEGNDEEIEEASTKNTQALKEQENR